MLPLRLRIVAVLIGMATAAFPQAGGITIESPRDFQVFQRKTKTSGAIRVAGHASGAGGIEVRVTGNSLLGPLPGNWTLLSVDRQSGVFSADLPTPAGGWYRCEFRVKDAAPVEAPHVGVGEVFIVAGQSNATNYGEVRQQTRSGMVAAYSSAGWQLANDPQPGVQDGSRNGSFIPAFGDALYERYQVPIGVAAVGHGSTSVRQWLPEGERFGVAPTMGKFVRAIAPGVWESDGTLFHGMMAAIDAFGRGGFRALLWHQGESDAHQKPEHDISAAEYKRLMEIVIRKSRDEAGWEFPWFVAQASYHTPGDPSCPPIRDAQRSLWTAGIAFEGPDTDQLVGDDRQNGGAGVHFSDAGLKAHGRLWADKIAARFSGLEK
jgi:hypothetical protein